MSTLYWPYVFADYYHWLEASSVIVGVLILFFSLDDLFFDFWYWYRQIYRYFTIRRQYKPLTAAQLRGKDEQALAIMVPAWLEYDVIALMLENMVSTVEYKNYMIFVGTYCNDARTIAEVERMRRRYRQLIRVEVPRAGPTCKADCLNWIVQAIFLHEKETRMPFAGVILHDSEDVLHPLEFKYFNYLLPAIDFIQLPVASLEREWYEFVAGTYMDEFAEWHTKDLVVRESLSKTVPSAGVGTCFSHRALMALAVESNNQPFNTGTLTEDYDIGARLAQRGYRQIFGKFPVEYSIRRTSWFGLGKETVRTLVLSMSVREFFPNTFRSAYRQKARWTLGISLQGWAQMGWSGSLATKYMLFRDRKGLVTSFIAVAAYFLLINFLIFIAADAAGLWTVYYPSRFAPDSWLILIMAANALVLLLRILQRIYFVGRMYGWEHGILSIPRMVVGNLINAMAAARAWRLYLAHAIFGQALVWDKTMHDYPSSDQFRKKHRNLGEILISWQAIDEPMLEHALTVQKNTHGQLGAILLACGYIDAAMLAEALAFQAGQVAGDEPAHMAGPGAEPIPA